MNSITKRSASSRLFSCPALSCTRCAMLVSRWSTTRFCSGCLSIWQTNSTGSSPMPTSFRSGTTLAAFSVTLLTTILIFPFNLIYTKIIFNLGGIIGGLISDLLRKRSVVIFALLILAIPSLYVFGGTLFKEPHFWFYFIKSIYLIFVNLNSFYW